jgi:NADH:ubiquinone oxidoreductase subunit E
MKTEEVKVQICMGSSCFSKGSNKIVVALEQFIEKNEFENIAISLIGCLCLNKCTKGPMVIINEKEYSDVNDNSIVSILLNDFNLKNRM